ncbi:NADH-quinone oxidoreductase subunit D [Vulgatibacter incomptus]|uniref:NADH-quinone oxidoreductase subunit D n=1 Tax=Vulgatibacter incomptus TaxID=1391653 RepID=A0A0K1PB90_9BACT|nr:NADH-quinone oxidoreductase subunit D [Vulgatibacter incomptus]AKU90686.1 NADH-ubiquinone oxidoreductase chain D [Vulgatibacter incomptus]
MAKQHDIPVEARPDMLEAKLPTKTMTLNMGPSHPASHGTVRFNIELDGENIVNLDPEIGFLHRGFEKSCENVSWTQCLPYTDRLNYVSALCNNFGFLSAVEKLAQIEIPERAKYIRTLGAELHRICDHLTATGATAMELGGFSVFFYAIEARDLLWDRIAELTGARLTTSFGRIGGVERDLPEGWIQKVKDTLDRVAELRDEVASMLVHNRIFLDRMKGTGVITAEDAVNFGFSGPCLRATGIDWDIRKSQPYWVYDRMDFKVPLGTHGDNFDRFYLRIDEMKESDSIVRQCFEQMQPGPTMIEDWRYALPPKPQVYSTIEGVIGHFKIVMEGIKIPKGECYAYTESPNGELGWYLVSDGSGRPYKVHCRAPGIPLLGGVEHMVKGAILPDLIPTFDTINMIGGEVEQ